MSYFSGIQIAELPDGGRIVNLFQDGMITQLRPTKEDEELPLGFYDYAMKPVDPPDPDPDEDEDEPEDEDEDEDGDEARTDAEFVEGDHPRGPDGKFGSGGGHVKATKVEGKHAAEGGGALPEHIAALRIPPAWEDVTYSPDAGSALLATGRDSKGRRQSIYSKEHTGLAAEVKFARIRELDEKFAQVLDENEAARKSDDPKKAAAADCTALIMATGIRPGSDDDTGAEVKAHGATTLEGRHVVMDGNQVRLRFVGKKGVSIDIPVENEEVARMLLDRKEKAGADGHLFPINEKALLDHVHTLDGGGFKTKDFRTRLGTRTAAEMVESLPKPESAADYKKAVMAVAKVVSEKLGNTPVVALQSYISPSVFASWRIAA